MDPAWAGPDEFLEGSQGVAVTFQNITSEFEYSEYSGTTFSLVALPRCLQESEAGWWGVNSN